MAEERGATADVYRDLRRGLRLRDADAPRRALLQWKSMFDARWGNHVARTVHALHWALGTDRERVLGGDSVVSPSPRVRAPALRAGAATTSPAT